MSKVSSDIFLLLISEKKIPDKAEHMLSNIHLLKASIL